MSARETLVTEAGYKKLQEELEHLTTTRRAEIAERIKTAREYGDVTENAEYDDAKNEQARVEQRIVQLEDRIRTAQIISEVDSSKVSVGTVVTVVDKKSKDEEKYTIVGSTEADPLEGKVSNVSPVGKALMGKKKGEDVKITVPSGTLEYTVKSIRVAK